MNSATPIEKHVVLVGAGNAHLVFLRRWRMSPWPGVAVTLVSESSVIPYSAMVPGHIAGEYGWDDITLDLVPLCRSANVRFVASRVTAIDATNSRIELTDRPALTCDVLSLGLGSLPAVVPGWTSCRVGPAALRRAGPPEEGATADGGPALDASLSHPTGVLEWSFSMRPLGRFVRQLEELESSLAESPRPFHLAIVGGGVSGCELALAIHRRFAPCPGFRVTLLQSQGRLLPTFPDRAARFMAQRLSEAGIDVRLNACVTGGDPGQLQVSASETLACDGVVWATPAAPPEFLRSSGLSVDASGFLQVGETLQSQSHSHVFGTGDCVSFLPQPTLPRNGVHAVRQGRVLFDNVRELLHERPLRAFRPQRICLCLMNTSDGEAILNYGSFATKGRLVRRWKERIDRAWLESFGLASARGASFEVVHSESRVATAVDSRGRQPTERGFATGLSREAATDSSRSESAAASRLEEIKADRNPWADAQGYLLTLLRSLRGAKSKNASEGSGNRSLARRAGMGDTAPHLMRCGGCGAKVSGDVLSPVLCELEIPDDPRVLMGTRAGDDAAVFRVPAESLGIPADKLVEVQTVDYFRSFLDDPYLFGRIAALHAVSDLFAMNARPFSALAIATLPYARGPIQSAQLRELLGGATRTFNELGVVLTGGHTSEGHDLSLGFSVTGFAHEDQLFRKGNLVPGDVLILTKPLGTGAVMAAWMRGECSATHFDEAIEQMLVANNSAAEVFASFGVRACTDVTGFGLAGHLLEMLDASRVSARLQASAVPILSGFVAAAVRGHLSTLHPDNARQSRRLQGTGSPPAWLFDPQTSGGLLAAVPENRASEVLNELQNRGLFRAAVIGQVLDDPKRIIELA